MTRITGEQARALLEAATPGPWIRDRNWTVTGPGNDYSRHYGQPGVKLDDPPDFDVRVCFVHGPRSGGSANLPAGDFYIIAAAPDLAATVIEQAAELDRVNGYLARLLEAAGVTVDGAWTAYAAEVAEDRIARLRRMVTGLADDIERHEAGAGLSHDIENQMLAECLSEAATGDPDSRPRDVVAGLRLRLGVTP